MVANSGCAWWREARDSLTRSQNLYRRALASEAEGDLVEATQQLREAVTASPDDPEIRWELARLLLDQGQTNEALQELRYLVQNHPDDSRAYMSLSRTLIERGRLEDAARLADLAIDVDSRCTEALLLRAQIAELRSDFDTARETYHQILLFQPELSDVRLRPANLELQQGEPRLAAALLREMLASMPLTPRQAAHAHWLLGGAYGRIERWPEAASELALGLQNGPGGSSEQYEFAYACYRAGRLAEARQALQLALRAEPTHLDAQALMAELTIPTSNDIRTVSGDSLPPPPAEFTQGTMPLPMGAQELIPAAQHLNSPLPTFTP